MRLRLFPSIFIIMLCLKTSLRQLQLKLPSASHREVLVKTLFTASKLANISERINFLVHCRRANVFPNFIQNLVHKRRSLLCYTRNVHFGVFFFENDICYFWCFRGYFRLIESEEGPVPKYNSFDHFNFTHFRIRYEVTAISIYFHNHVVPQNQPPTTST